MSDPAPPPGIDLVIEPSSHDLGGFTVRRALPSAKRQMVGPFIFVDQFGPAEFAPGRGIDVRPHPHIGIATVTYLFEGSFVHRDSLGSDQAIRPGEVNWMTAGRGIVHSERTGGAVRASGGPISGFQTWVALPERHEEAEPAFAHHGAADLPVVEGEGARVKLIAGAGFGVRSPLETLGETLYADVALDPGARLDIPAEADERGLMLALGTVEVAGARFDRPQLVVLAPGRRVTVTAVTAARFVLIGGAPMDGPRFIWWNFVSSRRERIEEAKRAWRERRFPLVPDDADERIPLPGEPS